MTDNDHDTTTDWLSLSQEPVQQTDNLLYDNDMLKKKNEIPILFVSNFYSV